MKKVFAWLVLSLLGLTIVMPNFVAMQKQDSPSITQIENKIDGENVDPSKPTPTPIEKDVSIQDQNKISWMDVISQTLCDQIKVDSNDSTYRGNSLPSGFTQIQYLESDMGQWIDTGVTVGSGGSVKIEMVTELTRTDLNQTFWWSKKTNSTDTWGCFNISGGFRFQSGSNNNYGSTISANMIYKITAENNECVICDAQDQELDRIVLASSTNEYEDILLMAMEDPQNGFVSRALMKLYSCKIYVDNVCVRDFIPCCNSSNVPGLYDVETSLFYASGHTQFVISYNLQGGGSKSDPYLITCATDLAYVSYYSNIKTDFMNNRYFKLTNDIYLNDGYFDSDGTYHDGGDGKLYEWDKTIRMHNNPTLLGNKCTIYGFYFNNSSNDIGLSSMSYLWKSVQDLTYSNFYVSCKQFYGFFAYRTTTISNCCLKKGYLYATSQAYAFVRDYASNVEKCANYAKIKGNNASMFGTVYETLKNCTNEGDIESLNGRMGGICMTGGKVNSSGTMIIENCVNKGNIKGSIVGGIIGGSNTSIQITNCENRGVISGIQVGGIAGYVDQDYEMINCKNFGLIQGQSSSGGLIGTIYTYYKNVNVKATGCVTEKTSFVIGVYNASATSNVANVTFKNCIFDCSKSDINSGNVFGYTSSVLQHNAKVNLYSVKIILGNNTNLYLFSGDAFEVSVRHVLINVNNDYDKEWGNNASVRADNLIIQKNKKPIAYYGSSFLAFFTSWRTGEIGLKTLESPGLYQKVVTEQNLRNRNAEKRG